MNDQPYPAMRERNGKGRGLAMLRLEASRYKLEMQRIRMQGHLHRHMQSIQSEHSEAPEPTTSIAPSRLHIPEDSPEAVANSEGSDSKPLLLNRVDAVVPQPEQLANAEAGTQTDSNSKKEAETETEETWVYGEPMHAMREGAEVSKASEPPAVESHTCSKHSEERNKKIDDVPDADVHKCNNYRVNATVLFTANPARVAVEDEAVSPLYTSTTKSAGKGKISNACEVEIETESLSGGSNNARISTMAEAKLEELLSTASGLRAVISSLPHNYSTCLPTRATTYNHGKRCGPFGNEKGDFSLDNHRQRDFAALSPVPAECNWSLYNVAHTDSNQRLGGRQRAPYAYQEDPIKEHTSANKGVQTDVIRGGTLTSRLTAQGIDCKPGAHGNLLLSARPSHTMHHGSTCRSRSTDWSSGVQDSESLGRTHGHKCLICGEMCCASKKSEKPCLAAHSFGLPKGSPRSQDGSDIDHENTNQRLQVKSSSQNLRCACECQAKWSQGDAKPVKEDGVSDLARPFHESCAVVDVLSSKTREGTATRGQRCPTCQNVLKSEEEKIQNVVNDNCHLCSSHYNEKREALHSCTTGTEYQPEDGPLNEITIEFPDGPEGEANITVSRNDCFEQPCYNVEVSATHDTPKQNQTENFVVSRQVSPPKYNCCNPDITRGSASWKDGCRVVCMGAPASSNNNHKNIGNMRSPSKFFDNGRQEPSHAGRRYVKHTNTPVRSTCRADKTGFNCKDLLPVEMPCIHHHLEKKDNTTLGKSRQDTHCKKFHADFDHKNPPVELSHNRHGHERNDLTVGNTNYMQHKKSHAEFDHTNSPVGTPSKLRHPEVKEFTLGKSQFMYCKKLHSDFDQRDPHVATPSKLHHHEVKKFTLGKSQDIHCKKFHSGFDHKDPHVETSCSLHQHDGKDLSFGRTQDMQSKDFRRHSSDNSDDDHQGPGLALQGRQQKSPEVPPKDKCPKDHSARVPETGSVGGRNLCGVHNDRETGRTNSKSPTKSFYRELGESSHTKRNEANHYATKVNSKPQSDSVEECTGNPSVSRATSRVSPHFLPDHVVRAAAAAEGLVKEIEVMMGAATAAKSKQPLHSSKPSLSLRHRPQPPALSEEQKEPCRQTKLDRAVVAAVQAVNKLDKIPMMSRVPHNAAPQAAAAARKWPTPPEKAFNEVTVGGGFYDQMHQELKELVSERMRLLRQEQARFRTAFLLSPCQQHKELLSKGERIDTTNQRNISAVNSDEDESGKGVREKMRRTSQEFQTPGLKRQRNASSPAREQANKLLRLSAGRVEAPQSGKEVLDCNVIALSSSLNEPANRVMRVGDPVKKFRFESPDFKFRVSKGGEESKAGRSSSAHGGGSVSAVIHRPPTSWSFGKWKPLNEKARKGNFSRWKFKSPAWVDSIQGRDIFYGLRPLAAACARDEERAKVMIKRRNLRPPGSIFKTLNKQCLGRLTRSGDVLSMVYSEPERLHSNNDVSTASIQYDIATGRRLVPGQDPEVRSEKRSEEKKQCVKGKMSSPIQRVSVPKRQSDVEGDQITHGVAESIQNNNRRLKGWNSDPRLTSDIPHKLSDIVRYNRFGSRTEQARKLRRTKSNKAEKGINLRHVTFASMDVRLEGGSPQSQKMDRAPHHTKGVLLQHPKRVKIYSSKERSSYLRTKKTPLQDRNGANINIGGGDIREGRWDYKEEFWTKMFKSEMEKVAHHKSLQSPVKCSHVPSLLASPSLELSNSYKNGEDWSSKLGFSGRTQLEEGHNKALTKYPAIWITGEQFDWETREFEGKESDDVVQGFDPASDNENSISSRVNMNNEGQINAPDEPDVTPQCPLAHQAASEPCNLDCTAIIKHKNPEVALQVDDLEQPGEEFPQSPLLLLDEALPVMDHEGYFSMFDTFKDSNIEPATHLKKEAEPGPSSLSISQQTSSESMGQENPARESEEIELEQTLMDIVLHTIFQDLDAPPSTLDRAMSPMSREKIYTIAEEEVEVPEKTSHWKPLAITPSVDKATDTDKILLSPKDQYCQTLEHKVPARFFERTMSLAHSVSDLQTQEHQATQTQVCLNCTGVQTSEAGVSARTSPMLVPVYISQFGPTMVPFDQYATPRQTPIPPMELFNVHQASVKTINQSTQAGVIQSRRISKAVNFQSQHDEGAPKRLPGVPEFSRHGKLGQGEVDLEDSESEWDELKMYSSSPVTPSTPLSSPGHNAKLKKALETCSAHPSTIQGESAVENEVHETTSKVSQKVQDDGREAQQMLECEQETVQNLLETEETHKSREEPHLHLPQQLSYGGISRRGTSWARVKEMEEAALSLLRTVLRNTPAATSSSEYSYDSSPSLCPDMSPGEMKTEGARDGGVCSSGEVLREDYNRYMSVQTHRFGQPGRSYIGNYRTLIPYSEPPSEGEVEAGVVLQKDEAGEIQGGLSTYTFGACFRTETEIGGSEPGELHVAIDCLSQMRAVS